MSSIEFSTVMRTIFFVDLCRYILTSIDFIAIPFFLQVAHLTQTEQNQQHMQHLTDAISLSTELKRVSRAVFLLR